MADGAHEPNAINQLLAEYVGERPHLEIERGSGVVRQSIYNWTRKDIYPHPVGLVLLKRYLGIPWPKIERALLEDAKRMESERVEREAKRLTARLAALHAFAQRGPERRVSAQDAGAEASEEAERRKRGRPTERRRGTRRASDQK